MSELKAIEYLLEYPLYRKDLDSMSKEHAAAFAVVSYAATESNILMKLYLSVSHKLIDDEAIDWLLLANQFVILRAWSAKLFEFSEFLRFGGKKKSTSDTTLRSLAADALERFESLKTTDGYELARIARNESTNHYSFKAARENLEHLSDFANYKLYLHEEGGNSFFPMGEELMFFARFDRHKKRLISIEERKELLKEWMGWNKSATQWLNDVHADFWKELVHKRLPDKVARERMWWIPPEMVGRTNVRTTPVFLRKPDK